VSALDLCILWVLLSSTVPSLRAFSVCKVALSKCDSRGGDCMGANSYAHSLSHSPWDIPAFPTCHACRKPYDTWPTRGRFCPEGFLAVVRTATFLHLMHRSFVSWDSSFWYWRCGLKTTFLYLLLLFGMPRPEASTPLLCRLLHGNHYPWVQAKDTLSGLPNSSDAFIVLGPGDTRGRSTLEAIYLKETLSWLAMPSSGFSSRGSIMLTLVNARGLHALTACCLHLGHFPFERQEPSSSPVVFFSGPYLRVPPRWLWSTPENRTVHKPPSLKLTTCSANRL